MPIISLDYLHLVLELMSNRYQNSLKIDCFDHRKEQCLINENMKCSLVLKLFTLANSHCLLRKNAIFITSVNTLEKLILASRVEKVTVIPLENQTL